MDSLAEALEHFNRKERNLLVRAVLGHEAKPLELSEDFRKLVADKLNIPIPKEAWWATDYHIAWLAGALAVYTEGAERAVAKGARTNRSLETDGSTKVRYLVEGNQEDIDLVIACGVDLILIEAKGVGARDNEQLRSKLARLKLVHSEYTSSTVKTQPAPRPINFHFLLTSPHHPEHLNVEWPDWARAKSGIPWIPLTFPSETLAVSRCNSAGQRVAEPDYWCIFKTKEHSIGAKVIPTGETPSEES
jgi:hypothetical protein